MVWYRGGILEVFGYLLQTSWLGAGFLAWRVEGAPNSDVQIYLETHGTWLRPMTGPVDMVYGIFEFAMLCLEAHEI